MSDPHLQNTRNQGVPHSLRGEAFPQSPLREALHLLEASEEPNEARLAARSSQAPFDCIRRLSGSSFTNQPLSDLDAAALRLIGRRRFPSSQGISGEQRRNLKTRLNSNDLRDVAGAAASLFKEEIFSEDAILKDAVLHACQRLLTAGQPEYCAIALRCGAKHCGEFWEAMHRIRGLFRDSSACGLFYQAFEAQRALGASFNEGCTAALWRTVQSVSPAAPGVELRRQRFSGLVIALALSNGRPGVGSFFEALFARYGEIPRAALTPICSQKKFREELHGVLNQALRTGDSENFKILCSLPSMRLFFLGSLSAVDLAAFLRGENPKAHIWNQGEDSLIGLLELLRGWSGREQGTGPARDKIWFSFLSEVARNAETSGPLLKAAVISCALELPDEQGKVVIGKLLSRSLHKADLARRKDWEGLTSTGIHEAIPLGPREPLSIPERLEWSYQTLKSFFWSPELSISAVILLGKGRTLESFLRHPEWMAGRLLGLRKTGLSIAREKLALSLMEYAGRRDGLGSEICSLLPLAEDAEAAAAVDRYCRSRRSSSNELPLKLAAVLAANIRREEFSAALNLLEWRFFPHMRLHSNPKLCGYFLRGPGGEPGGLEEMRLLERGLTQHDASLRQRCDLKELNTLLELLPEQLGIKGERHAVRELSIFTAFINECGPQSLPALYRAYRENCLQVEGNLDYEACRLALQPLLERRNRLLTELCEDRLVVPEKGSVDEELLHSLIHSNECDYAGPEAAREVMDRWPQIAHERTSFDMRKYGDDTSKDHQRFAHARKAFAFVGPRTVALAKRSYYYEDPPSLEEHKPDLWTFAHSDCFSEAYGGPPDRLLDLLDNQRSELPIPLAKAGEASLDKACWGHLLERDEENVLKEHPHLRLHLAMAKRAKNAPPLDKEWWRRLLISCLCDGTKENQLGWVKVLTRQVLQQHRDGVIRFNPHFGIAELLAQEVYVASNLSQLAEDYIFDGFELSETERARAEAILTEAFPVEPLMRQLKKCRLYNDPLPPRGVAAESFNVTFFPSWGLARELSAWMANTCWMRKRPAKAGSGSTNKDAFENCQHIPFVLFVKDYGTPQAEIVGGSLVLVLYEETGSGDKPVFVLAGFSPRPEFIRQSYVGEVFTAFTEYLREVASQVPEMEPNAGILYPHDGNPHVRLTNDTDSFFYITEAYGRSQAPTPKVGSQRLARFGGREFRDGIIRISH